ncbi:hypothetical protein SAMN05444170_4369 [Bradyrhizobium erythrophlei]|uniref:Uncharacterized protein n=1 Tax=Bradyrhizobium erythrophlei TaxID=1437360 RepID=A0A1M7UC03_9BRAD|nr:hypothetical protein SAMN05444170_4369 [Bradyrhizobium erythrophlei]
MSKQEYYEGRKIHQCRCTDHIDLWFPARAMRGQTMVCSLSIQPHFCMQSGLSVSSRPRALAYSISACRAASQRSSLVNSCVDITAPLTAPSQLMTIRTWVTISSITVLFRGALRLLQTTSCFAWRSLDDLGQAVSAPMTQISGTAPMKAAPEHVAPNEQLPIDLHQREALKSRVPAGRSCRPVLTR